MAFRHNETVLYEWPQLSREHWHLFLRQFSDFPRLFWNALLYGFAQPYFFSKGTRTDFSAHWKPASGICAFTLILLAVNNFTHTVLHFGIINSTGIVRAIYALFFLTTFGFCIRTVLDILPRISDGYR
jgi:hypothetical protein